MTASSNLDLAGRRSQRLLALMDGLLPQSVHSAGTHDDWNVTKWALLARATRSLRAITQLQPGLFNLDAGVLLRCMFEHVVTFAWLATDPAALMPLWVKNDRAQRLSADNDWPAGAPRILDPQVRAAFEAEVQAIPGSFPSLPQRAEVADRHWSAIINDHPPSTENQSFRGMYRIIYRHGSALTHVTAYGLQDLTSEAEGSVIIVNDAERLPENESNNFTLAPIVIGTGLVIASEEIGRPNIDELNAAFE